jgi:hypothetical protein
MRRFFAIIILIICFSGEHFSQTDSVYYGDKKANRKREADLRKQEWKEKTTYGGNFQLLFFGQTTFIYLTPTIGYLPHKKLNVGVGAVYSYRSDITLNGRYSQSLWGGHTFAHYMIIPNLSIMAEYDKLNQPDWLSGVPDKKVWVDYLMAGLGFIQPAGDKVSFHSSLMYNLTPHRLSIYRSNLVLQFGITARI